MPNPNRPLGANESTAILAAQFLTGQRANSNAVLRCVRSLYAKNISLQTGNDPYFGHRWSSKGVIGCSCFREDDSCPHWSDQNRRIG